MQRKWFDPEQVFEEYERGKQFKSGLGTRGLYDQNKKNERFFVGDQWYGAKTGDKPLVRYNIIKRIGDYKMAILGSAAVAVNYTAEGVPNTQYIKEKVRAGMEELRTVSETGNPVTEETNLSSAEKINLAMAAMSDYFKTTAERVKFEDLKADALRKAYIGGTGVLYTYWDERVKTGLYADEARTSPIVGDIRCEVLDIENVYFGDPNMENVQEQPFIILAQRKSVEELKRTARRYRRKPEEIDAIKPDEEKGFMAGDRANDEPQESKKATVLTKLYKEWDDEGLTYKVMAVEVVKGAIIRKPWDIGVRLYPLARFAWEQRNNCAYGDSEITNLIPNQIAINRSITAAIWAVMMIGMPIMVVNGDVVTGPITNEPGQIVKVYGSGGDVSNAVKYAIPPNFSPQFDNLVSSLIVNTLNQSGANDAALGDMRPDNTSAIIAVREAATMPMQMQKNRFNSFIEDIARIWAEFWVCLYGKRSLKIEDKQGEWYMPFDGEEYKELLISARVDVGEAGLWSEIQERQTLDNLLLNKIIDPMQYLERLPKGSVPDLGGLIRDLEGGAAQITPPVPTVPKENASPEQPIPTGEMTADDVLLPQTPDFAAIAQQIPPEYAEKFSALPDEMKQQVIAQMMGQ